MIQCMTYVPMPEMHSSFKKAQNPILLIIFSHFLSLVNVKANFIFKYGRMNMKVGMGRRS